MIIAKEKMEVIVERILEDLIKLEMEKKEEKK